MNTSIYARVSQVLLTAGAVSLPCSTLAAEQDLKGASAELAAKALRLFGAQPGQSFRAEALAPASVAPRTDSLTLTLAPGKGAELKFAMDAGQGFVFEWSASSNVLVDMHGERPGATDEYTSYWVDTAQRFGAGTWVAPFTGEHGWYWRNRGDQPVTIKVSVTGFHLRMIPPKRN
jgi:hypothetical protein